MGKLLGIDIDSMKALFIGGTGTISSAITRLVSQNPDWQLYLINRGNRIAEVPDGVVNRPGRA